MSSVTRSKMMRHAQRSRAPCPTALLRRARDRDRNAFGPEGADQTVALDQLAEIEAQIRRATEATKAAVRGIQALDDWDHARHGRINRWITALQTAVGFLADLVSSPNLISEIETFLTREDN